MRIWGSRLPPPAETLDLTHSVGPFASISVNSRLHPKGHPVKANIARRLRSESSMSRQWIADRLKMGNPSYLSALTSVLAPGGATHRFQSQVPLLEQKFEQQRLLILQGVPSL